MYAIEYGLVQVADVLLRRGADTDTYELFHGTPLDYCCHQINHVHFIPTLLRYGAAIQGRRIGAASTPLHLACQNSNLQRASVLVAHGADINARDYYNTHPISVCSNPDIIRMLLANGAQVNLRDVGGETALHLAYPNIEVVEVLLSNNANIEAQNDIARHRCILQLTTKSLKLFGFCWHISKLVMDMTA